MFNKKNSNEYFSYSKNFLDLRGLICPDPIILLRKKFREINPKDIILIFSDDITTKRDFIIFCNFMGHNLIDYFFEYLPYRFLIQKGNKTMLKYF